jgi:hypothetical protein
MGKREFKSQSKPLNILFTLHRRRFCGDGTHHALCRTAPAGRRQPKEEAMTRSYLGCACADCGVGTFTLGE